MLMEVSSWTSRCGLVDVCIRFRLDRVVDRVDRVQRQPDLICNPRFKIHIVMLASLVLPYGCSFINQIRA